MKIAKKLSILTLAALGSSMAHAAVTNVEGSAGGGLVPWALMHPGFTASYTHVDVQNYKLNTLSAGATFAGHVEVSASTTMVDAPVVGAALKLDSAMTMNTLGLKVKLVDMGKIDDMIPQVAVGLQYKAASGDIVDALAAGNVISSKTGTDFYIAATKFVNIGGKKVVMNGTLRATKANTLGVLGFGGGAAGNDSYKILPEASLGVFAADNIVLGAEVRAKPNNISATAFGIQEGTAYDLFMVYFVNKNMSITTAYANLGQVGPSQAAGIGMAKKQDGFYIQMQVNF